MSDDGKPEKPTHCMAPMTPPCPHPAEHWLKAAKYERKPGEKRAIRTEVTVSTCGDHKHLLGSIRLTGGLAAKANLVPTDSSG